MEGTGAEGKGKEEVAACGPLDFAEMCQRMMSTEPRQGCGNKMQEMMSRCMPYFLGGQTEPRQGGTEGGDDDEGK